MNPVTRNLTRIWDQLRSEKPSRQNHLEDVQINELRGIKELRVPFSYPVSVLAGANGSGKSAVLFALATAYSVPGVSPRKYTPTSLFPGYHPDDDGVADSRNHITLVFSYIADNQRQSMQWKRSSSKWNRSFFGRQSASQPQRKLYLRTLANLTNPSEVRDILQIAHKSRRIEQVDAASIAFAERILGFRYANISRITTGVKDLLFAERDGGVRYSEFHMSAGERALLRLSLEISQLRDALVLIDEVDTGLHPYIQQVLMLELQRLALRNQLQVVVTSHSPVVLDSVPPEARIFLERDGDAVRRCDPYRDIIQKSLYGQSQDKLSFLCEDDVAEALLRGVMEHIGSDIGILQNDIEIGRDTGKDQYPAHLETLARFKRLHDVVFVLDGDGRDVGLRLESRAEQLGQVARTLFMPGMDAPEVWCWEILSNKSDEYAVKFGIQVSDLRRRMQETDALYSNAADKPSNIVKAKLASLANFLSRETADIARIIGREEAASGMGAVQELVVGLKDAVLAWRSFGVK
jgi:predicted ATPase